MPIPVDKIEISGRSERDLGNIRELARSIQEFGQLLPIIVQPIEETDRYLLIAGERRVTAFKKIGLKEIGAELRDNLSIVNRKELELEENIQRKQLTPMEKQRAIKDLFNIKKKHYDSNTNFIGQRKYTQSMFADEHNMSQSEVSRAVKLGDALDKYPSLEKANNLLDAERKLRVLEIEQRNSLASGITLEFWDDPLEGVCSVNDLESFRTIYHNYYSGEDDVVGGAEERLSKYGSLLIEPVEGIGEHPVFMSNEPTILRQAGLDGYKKIYSITRLKEDKYSGEVISVDRNYDFRLSNSHGKTFWERILRSSMRESQNKNILFINMMDFSMCEFILLNGWRASYCFTNKELFSKMSAALEDLK